MDTQDPPVPGDPVTRAAPAARPSDPATRAAPAARPSDPVTRAAPAARAGDPVTGAAPAARPGDPVTGAALAARAGDPAAAARFVRATQVDVWRLCAHLGDPGETQDLAQETYLRAFRALPAFAARSGARTWLLAIARRVCADAVRERRRRPRVDLTADVPDAPGPGTDLGEGVVLRQAVAALHPDRRDAFVLTQLVGLSYPEAAEVCGCPVGTIRSRVARARSDLVGLVRDERLSAPHPG